MDCIALVRAHTQPHGVSTPYWTENRHSEKVSTTPWHVSCLLLAREACKGESNPGACAQSGFSLVDRASPIDSALASRKERPQCQKQRPPTGERPSGRPPSRKCTSSGSRPAW